MTCRLVSSVPVEIQLTALSLAAELTLKERGVLQSVITVSQELFK